MSSKQVVKTKKSEAPLPYTCSAKYLSFEAFREADPWEAEKALRGMRALGMMVDQYLCQRPGG